MLAIYLDISAAFHARHGTKEGHHCWFGFCWVWWLKVFRVSSLVRAHRRQARRKGLKIAGLPCFAIFGGSLTLPPVRTLHAHMGCKTVSKLFNHVQTCFQALLNLCLRVLWELRRFLFLENVSNILSKDFHKMMKYLLQDAGVIQIGFSGVQFLLHILAGGGEERSEHPMGHVEWSWCCSTGRAPICFCLLPSLWFQVSPSFYSGLATKDFLFGPEKGLWLFPGTININSFASISKVYIHMWMQSSTEGMKLNDIDMLKTWPECAWHRESRPLLYRWLSMETSKENQQRLHCVGNIVMPDMAYLAANMLGHGEVP